MSDEPYEPFDQEARLPPPPWSPDDPALKAWEAAHGHDVRLKCYAEFGCLVIEEFLEREVARLESQNQALQEEAADALTACQEGVLLWKERAEKAEALLSLVRFDPAKGVYPDTPGWRLIQERDALQERAEKAEKALRDLGHGNHDHGLPPSVTCPACEALSPTQETDRPKPRGGLTPCPNCGTPSAGIGSHCTACPRPTRPTQETDPS